MKAASRSTMRYMFYMYDVFVCLYVRHICGYILCVIDTAYIVDDNDFEKMKHNQISARSRI